MKLWTDEVAVPSRGGGMVRVPVPYISVKT